MSNTAEKLYGEEPLDQSGLLPSESVWSELTQVVSHLSEVT